MYGGDNDAGSAPAPAPPIMGGTTGSLPPTPMGGEIGQRTATSGPTGGRGAGETTMNDADSSLLVPWQQQQQQQQQQGTGGGETGGGGGRHMFAPESSMARYRQPTDDNGASTQPQPTTTGDRLFDATGATYAGGRGSEKDGGPLNPLQHIAKAFSGSEGGGSGADGLSRRSSTSHRSSSSPADAALTRLHRTHLHVAALDADGGTDVARGDKPDPPLARYRVVKLRSWRTGYARIVTLHESHFNTLDPETRAVTNRWSYDALVRWMALPKEEGCVLIEVLDDDPRFRRSSQLQSQSSQQQHRPPPPPPPSPHHHNASTTKLKFKTDDRVGFLTSLLRLKYEHDVRNLPRSVSGAPVMMPYPLFGSCYRATRRQVRRRPRPDESLSGDGDAGGNVRDTVPCCLLVAPHGLLELAPRPTPTPSGSGGGTALGGGGTMTVLRIYEYRHIRSVSFTADDPNGIVLKIGGGGGGGWANGIYGYNYSPHGGGGGYNGGARGSRGNHDKTRGSVPPRDRLFFVTSSSSMSGGYARSGGGHGRSDLVTVMKGRYDDLGLPWIISESTRASLWFERRNQWGWWRWGSAVGLVTPSAKDGKSEEELDAPAGPAFRVHKVTARRGGTMATAKTTRVGGSGEEAEGGKGAASIPRDLVLTQGGRLVERDEGERGVAGCRGLAEVFALVRHRGSDDISDRDAITVTIEYRDGSSRTYESANGDALCVSLLDGAACLGNNRAVLLTDVGTDRYRFLPRDRDGQGGMSGGGGRVAVGIDPSQRKQKDGDNPIENFFQPDSVPLQCLRRLHQVASAALAYLDQHSESSVDASRPIDAVDECQLVVEACRELYANVNPRDAVVNGGCVGEGGGELSDSRAVRGALEALWGIVLKLLSTTSPDGALVTGSGGGGEGGTAASASAEHLTYCRRVEQALVPIMQALHRLCRTKVGHGAIADVPAATSSFPLLVRHVRDPFAAYWFLRTLLGLISPLGGGTSGGATTPSDNGGHERDLERETEFVNKTVMFGSPGLVEGLVGMMIKTGGGGGDGGGEDMTRPSDLILLVVSEILESVLCSNHDTTSPNTFAAFIAALSREHNALVSMLRCSTPLMVENAALLLQLVTAHSPQTASLIRDDALSSAVILQHFHSAIFSPLESQRFLSRYLCSLWMSGPMGCDEKRLLRRMVPGGFLCFLSMPILSQVEEDQLDEIERGGVEEDSTVNRSTSGERTESAVGVSTEMMIVDAGANIARLRSRIAIATSVSAKSLQPRKVENFRIFFHVLTRDHALPDLIWNEQTRRELRSAIETELDSIKQEEDARGGANKIAWNHQQFAVGYPSLRDEVRVGDVYMRLWLQAGDGFIRTWEEPLRLFELLFRRLLCDMDRDTMVTNMCIRCLERLYSIHSSSIGTVSDIMILVRSMALTKNVETQHRLLSLLATLLGVPEHVEKYGEINVPGNAEQLLNAESINLLCHFVAWGHTNNTHIGKSSTGAVESGEELTLPTDETEAVHSGGMPSATGAGGQSSVGHIDSSPAVWFIAPAGSNPPPASAIQGPFRVCQLLDLMTQGRLHPHSLVKASCVDGDSFGDDSNAAMNGAGEVHDDTDKWRMLEQVWQLRWQLCTNGHSKGVYGVADVALMALRSLSRLVDLHRSFDSRGLPYFPLPIAKRLLCGASDVSLVGSSLFHDGTPVDTRGSMSVISQALLCSDHRIVESAAIVLHKLMTHNDEACAKFYLTGAFLFAFTFTGNNIRFLAPLICDTHLKQHFWIGSAAAADETSMPLKDRSILGSMLPQGIIRIIVKCGVDSFVETFLGDFDNPEVIWDSNMRRHLVEMVHQHIGDFPQRLQQNITAKYAFIPIPKVSYRRLEKEMFCHNYYLNNLCDEVRFPNWPITEPVELFRACLEEWKQQINQDKLQEREAQEEARKFLGLSSDDGGSELRKAYRAMARKYYPVLRDSAGRDTFEKVQRAYETLLPIVEEHEGKQCSPKDETDSSGGPSEMKSCKFDDLSEGLSVGDMQMQAIHLLLKTQLMIFKRYSIDVGKYKYPAYKMLLSCLHLPPTDNAQPDDTTSDQAAETTLSSCMLAPKRAQFVLTSVELLFHTCLVSPRNAEALVEHGGVPILECLLNYYISAAKTTLASRALVYEIISHVVHTIAGVAYYDSGREALLDLKDPIRLCQNWRRCVDGFLSEEDGHFVELKTFALEGVTSMARSAELQNLLVRSGMTWPLIKCMLSYDPTLEEVSTLHDEASEANKSQLKAHNSHARISARALGMLCGIVKDPPRLMTPPNHILYHAMKSILTSPMAKMLRNQHAGELLRTLNTVVETPTRIWSTRMRNELATFVDKMMKGRDDLVHNTVEDELEPATSSFEYTSLSDEVIIGGVYVRVFSGLDGGREGIIQEIPDCQLFAKELLGFITRCLERRDGDGGNLSASSKHNSDEKAEDAMDEDTHWLPVSDPRFVMSVSALRFLVNIDGLIDEVLCDDETHAPTVLLKLLELPRGHEAFGVSAEILSLMAPKQLFADAVARQEELWRLLKVVECSDEEEGENKDEDESGVPSKEDRDQEATLAFPNHEERLWQLLESLVATPSVADAMVQSSGWLELLAVLSGYSHFTKSYPSRLGAAKTLQRILWDPKIGPNAEPLLLRFIPLTLVSILKGQGAGAMLRIFDAESETPELIWGKEMRDELRSAIADRLSGYLKERDTKKTGNCMFDLAPNFHVEYEKLEEELYIGGVYIGIFTKEPTFCLPNPSGFLEMALLRWVQELESVIEARSGVESNGSGERQDILEQLTSAIVALCEVRETCCDKLADWGYNERLISFLRRTISSDLLGSPLLSIVRLLRVAVTRKANVGAIAPVGKNGRDGIVDCIIQAIGNDPLHPDCAIMIDVLQKTFETALVGNLETRGAERSIECENGVDESMHHSQKDTSGGHDINGSAGAVDPTLACDNAPGSPMGSSHAPQEDCQTYAYENGLPEETQFYAMAPSPAPGLEPVRKLTKSNNDHPLFMHVEPDSTPLGSQSRHLPQPAPSSTTHERPQPAETKQLSRSQLSDPHSGPHYVQRASGIAPPLYTPGTMASYQNAIHSQTPLQPDARRQLKTNVPPQQDHAATHSYERQSFATQQIKPTTQVVANPGAQSQARSPLDTHRQMPTSVAQQQYNAAPHKSEQRYSTATSQLISPTSGETQAVVVNESDHISQPEPMSETQQLHAAAPLAAPPAAPPPPPPPPALFPSSEGEIMNAPYQIIVQQVGAGSEASLGDSTVESAMAAPQYATEGSQPARPPGTYCVFPQQVQLEVQHSPLQPSQEAVHRDVSYPLHGESCLAPTSSPSQQQTEEQETSQTEVGAAVPAETHTHDPVQRSTAVPRAPGCTQGRLALLHSALECNLPRFLLLDVLENPTLPQVRDPDAAKVHSIELLNLLASDPDFGLKFSIELNGMPEWGKYKSQKDLDLQSSTS